MITLTNNSFVCELCYKSFAKKYSLHQHEQAIHYNSSKYKQLMNQRKKESLRKQYQEVDPNAIKLVKRPSNTTIINKQKEQEIKIAKERREILRDTLSR